MLSQTLRVTKLFITFFLVTFFTLMEGGKSFFFEATGVELGWEALPVCGAVEATACLRAGSAWTLALGPNAAMMPVCGGVSFWECVSEEMPWEKSRAQARHSMEKNAHVPKAASESKPSLTEPSNSTSQAQGCRTGPCPGTRTELSPCSVSSSPTRETLWEQRGGHFLWYLVLLPERQLPLGLLELLGPVHYEVDEVDAPGQREENQDVGNDP